MQQAPAPAMAPATVSSTTHQMTFYRSVRHTTLVCVQRTATVVPLIPTIPSLLAMVASIKIQVRVCHACTYVHKCHAIRTQPWHQPTHLPTHTYLAAMLRCRRVQWVVRGHAPKPGDDAQRDFRCPGVPCTMVLHCDACWDEWELAATG